MIDRVREAFVRVPFTPLAQTIESLAAPPTLDVIARSIARPPHPSGIAPPLSRDGTLHARTTSYRLREVRLSRHLAFVDPSRLSPLVVDALEADRLNLGQLFSRGNVDKLEFDHGDDVDARTRLALDDFLEQADDMRPYLWRRYAAAVDGRVAVVVIEVMDLGAWERLRHDR